VRGSEIIVAHITTLGINKEVAEVSRNDKFFLDKFMRENQLGKKLPLGKRFGK